MRDGRRLALSFALSIAVHAALLVVAHARMRLPDVDVDIEIVSGLELGVFDDPKVSAAERASTSDDTPATTQGDSSASPPSKPKAERPARTQAQPPAATTPANLADFAPKGSLIALRMDLERVQATPLAQDAARLLSAVPDVSALLDGSGIEPVRDLAKLFIATPDLQRAHAVIAGQYRGDRDLPRLAVERLARASGKPVRWRNARGIPIAPWHNADATARIVALLPDSVFAVTREDDLPRVLAIARHLGKRLNAPPTSTSSTGDGLLRMAPDELLSLSVDNARSFVRGPRAQNVPDQLSVSVRYDASAAGELEVRIGGTFSSASQAKSARHFWDDLRERYAEHPLVALVGLSEVLRAWHSSLSGTELRARVRLPITQARLLLGFARDAVATRPIADGPGTGEPPAAKPAAR